jgi:putative iron-regulated protein
MQSEGIYSMKFLKLVLIISLLTPSLYASEFSKTYAEAAFTDYSAVQKQAELLQKSIDTFLLETTPQNFENVKNVWTEARKAYSITEIYRFYGGPIDDENGPEDLINSWPLDEAYIDYVKGNSKSGIINQVDLYPEITKELVIELNQKDGEKNISTGWHAIEFLLWGQDFNLNGPGQRPLKDFQEGLGQNALRRRTYLKILGELLVENLQYVASAWNPLNINSYNKKFLDSSEQDNLTKAFTSLISMSSDELAIERMFVAYDTQLQEDEDSCFSDTTHFDLLYNFIGIKNLWMLVKNSKDIAPELKDSVDKRLSQIEVELENFKGPFDQAIFEPEGRKQILFIVNSLQEIAEQFKIVANNLGITL